MIIPLKEPKVKLLGSYNSVKEAWIASRPHLSANDMNLHQVDDLDLPVHSFATYAFDIQGSIAMRELLYMVRPAGCWAVSYRTIDLCTPEHVPLSTEIPSKLMNIASGHNNTFLDAKASGVPQDLCKNMLSYGTVIGFSIALDLRTLSNVVKGLKKFAPLLYEIYGKQFIELVPELETRPGGDWLLNDLTINSEDLAALKNGPFKMGRMNIVGGLVGGSLHAQAIRKQYDKVYSDIVPHILSGDIYGMSQETEFTCIMYLPDSSFKFLQSTRTCFFAMYDKESTSSWSSLLNVKHLTPTEFRDQLPCKGQASLCKFHKEQLPRLIAGNKKDYESEAEVNFPCPIMIGLNGTQHMRTLKYGSNSEIHKKWDEMLDEMDLEITTDGEEFYDNVMKFGFAEACDNEPSRRLELEKLLIES